MQSDEQLVAEQLHLLLKQHPPSATSAEEFLGAQFDAGLAFVHFPVSYGGLGLSRKLQPVVSAALEKAGAPKPRQRNGVGYGMAAPTIVTLGSEAQRRRYLRPLFTCEEIWCQLFSEPGAGSDVASLATRAVRDGDEWVINGQKVWTSLAHLSRFGMLLARTDTEVEKHKGLTYFVVDMKAPGVEVRPLKQMTGSAEFGEVYLTDVRIPDSERLTEVGDGWRGAIITLMNERVSIGGTVPARGTGPISAALDIWSNIPAYRRSAVRRDRLAFLWVAAEVLRLTNMRAAGLAELGTPGPEGSIGKLANAELNKEIYDFCLDMLGSDGTLNDHSTVVSFLRSRANSIEGGTSEVMRNILGERVLGLPRDVRVDEGVPWSRVLRNIS